MKKSINVFYSYAHEDERLRKKLEAHLALLQRQGFITAWHDQKISAGTEWANEINSHLNGARIILLLISSSFLASQYCYGNEMTRALERHRTGTARVIPIILRPVDWQNAPFSQLQALPTGGRPVTGRGWHNTDEAFADIAQSLRKIVEEMWSQDGNLSQDTQPDLLPGTKEPQLFSSVVLIDASLDLEDSLYEQTTENGKKVIQLKKNERGNTNHV